MKSRDVLLVVGLTLAMFAAVFAAPVVVLLL